MGKELRHSCVLRNFDGSKEEVPEVVMDVMEKEAMEEESVWVYQFAGLEPKTTAKTPGF